MAIIYNSNTGQYVDTNTGEVVGTGPYNPNFSAPPQPPPPPPQPPALPKLDVGEPGAEPNPTDVDLGIIYADLGDLAAALGILGTEIGAIKNFLRVLRDAVASLVGLLSKIWKRILAPLFQRFYDWFQRLHRIYNQIIRPALQQLERYRQLIRRIYNLYFAPILQTLAAIRTFLSITRLNRTAFGRALDARLADLEAKVYTPIQLALSTINDQARLLNVILAPDLFFQQVTHVGSVFRDMGHIADLFYNLSAFPNVGARDAILLRIAPAQTPQEDRQAFADLLTTRAGAFGVDYSQDNTALANQLRGS